MKKELYRNARSWLRFIVLFVLFCLAPFGLAKDKNSYYILDSVKYYGVRLADYGVKENCLNLSDTVNGELVKFTPYQVSEYCYEGKRFYVAKDIQLNDSLVRVFLERIPIGDITLYHYRGEKKELFFVQKEEGPLVELKELEDGGSNYKSQLAEWSKSCPTIAAKSGNVKYNRQSIVYFLNEVKNGHLGLFPPGEFSIGFGLTESSIEILATTTDPDYRIFDFQPSYSYHFGIQLDQPIMQFGLSLHMNCLYTKVYFAANKQLFYTSGPPPISRLYESATTLHTIDIPIYLRYALPLRGLKPFIEAGGQFSWNFVNVNNLDRSLIKGTLVDFFGRSNPRILDNYNIGPAIGLGVVYPLRKMNAVFLECHYAHLQGLINAELSQLSKFTLTTGYTF